MPVSITDFFLEYECSMTNTISASTFDICSKVLFSCLHCCMTITVSTLTLRVWICTVPVIMMITRATLQLFRHIYIIFQLQKLLFSATLSHNPEKLQQLNLFMPCLLTSVVMEEPSQSHPQSSKSDQKEKMEGAEDKGKYFTDPFISTLSPSSFKLFWKVIGKIRRQSFTKIAWWTPAYF